MVEEVLGGPIEAEFGEVSQHGLQVGLIGILNTGQQLAIDLVLVLIDVEGAPGEIRWRQFIRAVFVGVLDDLLETLHEPGMRENRSAPTNFLPQPSAQGSGNR